jgi:branched-chain amino acid transport system substrate-binding protein
MRPIDVKKVYFRTIAALLALALAGYATIARAAEPPIVIPAILSVTGPVGFIGSGEQQFIVAYEKALNAAGGINGRPVHFDIKDDQSNPQITIQLVNAVIASKGQVILGPGNSSTCDATGPLVTNGPVMYCLSPSFHPARGTYAFTAGVSTQDNVAALIHYFRGKGLTRFAQMTSIDASGQDGDRWIKAAMALPENKNLQIVDAEHFSPADLTVVAQMTRIKQANPQVLLAWTAGTAFVTVVRAYSDSGMEIPIGTSTGNMVYPEMKQLASYNDRHFYFAGFRFFEEDTLRSGPLKDGVLKFYRAIADNNVQHADAMAGTSWDAAAIIVSALRKLGPDATATQIRDYMLGLSGYVGINGVYNFSDGMQRGLNVSAATIMHWDRTAEKWIPVSLPGGAPRTPN